MHVLPVTSILGRLPAVGKEIWIPSRQAIVAAATTVLLLQPQPRWRWLKKRAGDACPTYLVNSWALGWCRDPWSGMKCSVWYVLLHIITSFSCIITWFTSTLITYYHVFIIMYSYIIITSLIIMPVLEMGNHVIINLFLRIMQCVCFHYYVTITLDYIFDTKGLLLLISVPRTCNAGKSLYKSWCLELIAQQPASCHTVPRCSTPVLRLPRPLGPAQTSSWRVHCHSQ